MSTWAMIGKEIQASDMSKLAHIRAALTNASVSVLSEEGHNYLPGKNGYWSQTVSFFVATPKSKEGSDLDAFAKALIPDLETSAFDSARFGQGFALLYYDEAIGTLRTQCTCEYTLNEPGALREMTDGKWIKKLDKLEILLRRTWVYVFPDIETARSKAIDREVVYPALLG